MLVRVTVVPRVMSTALSTTGRERNLDILTHSKDQEIWSNLNASQRELRGDLYVNKLAAIYYIYSYVTKRLKRNRRVRYITHWQFYDIGYWTCFTFKQFPMISFIHHPLARRNLSTWNYPNKICLHLRRLRHLTHFCWWFPIRLNLFLPIQPIQ